jgi:hypothetical protein
MHIKRESCEWYYFHVEIGKRKKRQNELLFLALPISRPRALAGTLVWITMLDVDVHGITRRDILAHATRGNTVSRVVFTTT